MDQDPQIEFQVESQSYAEANTPYSLKSRGTQGASMTRWLIKVGVAKDEKVANIILLVIACIFFATTIYLLIPSSTFQSLSKPTTAPSTPARLHAQQLLQQRQAAQ
jgi:hypothetical protein